MTVKEFKELFLFKGEIKFFDYATGDAIGEEFKTEENERLQELEIAGIELGIKSIDITPAQSLIDSYVPIMKVFVDVTKTLKMREAIKTIEMSQYNAWYVRDTKDSLLYSNDEYIKDNGYTTYRAKLRDLPIKALNSIVTKIRTTCDGHITFNIIDEEKEEN